MHGASLIGFCATMVTITVICALISAFECIEASRCRNRARNAAQRAETIAEKAHQLQLYREMDHYVCRRDAWRAWCIFGSPYCPWKPVTARDVSKN